MTRLLGISGSLRAGSFNTALLRNAGELAPDGVTLGVHTLHGIPSRSGTRSTGPRGRRATHPGSSANPPIPSTRHRVAGPISRSTA